MRRILKRRPRDCRDLRRKKSTAPGAGQSGLQPNLQRYSFIYNDLVEDREDFIGLVAYSLYRQAKINYVKKFEENHGRAPEPKELVEFHDLARSNLAVYKEIAANRVSDFYEDIYKTKAAELESQYQERLTAKLAKIGGWWTGVWQSFVGSLLFSTIIGIFVVCILYSQYGLGWIAQDIIKKAIIQP